MTRYQNPIYRGSAADPAIIKGLNGDYYVYATGNVRLKSSDLITWTHEGDWGLVGAPDDSVTLRWAPDVTRMHGVFVLTWAGGTADKDMADDASKAIYWATSDHASGPWQYGGKLTDLAFPIDPTIFVDTDGTPYLFFGGGQLHVAKLSFEDGKLAAVTESTELIHRNPDATIEGSWVTTNDGWYYLIYSYGNWDKRVGPPEYRLQVARSRNVMGPYEPSHQEAKTILEGNHRFWGPGHNSTVIGDNGHEWIVYHAWDGDERVMMLDKIEYVDGWPQINDGHPSVDEQDGPATQG